jgi:hypothetical protein
MDCRLAKTPESRFCLSLGPKPINSNMKQWKLLPVLFLATILTANAQQRTAEKTLLWRISGNGSKTASYLYGTMHLRDTRLFNFTDSLYVALEQCERLALEFQPDSVFSAILQDVDFMTVLMGARKSRKDADIDFDRYVERKLSRRQLDSLKAAVKAATGVDDIDYKKLIARKRLGYGEWDGEKRCPCFWMLGCITWPGGRASRCRGLSRSPTLWPMWMIYEKKMSTQISYYRPGVPNFLQRH